MPDEPKRLISAYADQTTVKALRELARVRTDNNLSMALRFAVRETAERAGVVISEGKAGGEGAQHA